MRSRAGLEQSLNDYLTASNSNLTTVLDRTLDRIKGATVKGNDVHLTLSTKGQQVARAALGTLCGSVVALEPRTGRVLVMESSPSYDPNLIEGRFNQATRSPAAQCTTPAPLLNRATDGLYTPGSTFKVITASAAIDTGAFSLSSTFSDPGYCEEYGKKVFNYSDQSGPESFGTLSLLTAIQNSVNSVFCTIGKQLGALKILEYARRFGFYSQPPVELPVDERKASGLYKNGELWLAEGPERGRPGAARVRPGRAAGDADPDGDGRGRDRQQRRRHEAVPRRPHRLAGRRPGGHAPRPTSSGAPSSARRRTR